MMEPSMTIDPRLLLTSSSAWGTVSNAEHESTSPSPVDSNSSSSGSETWNGNSNFGSPCATVAVLGAGTPYGTMTATQPLFSALDEGDQSSDDLAPHVVQEVWDLERTILQKQIEFVQLFQEKQDEIELLKAHKRYKVTRWKKFFSLIYKLPDDVFLMIFEIHVLEHGCNPWILASVSTRFRGVAFKARKIWARVILKSSYGGFLRNQNGWEICKTPSHLDMALNRAGGADLSVSMHSCDPISAAVITARPNRWTSLTYADHGNRIVDTELFSEPRRFTSVEKLHVAGGGILPDSRLVEWIQTSPPPNLVLIDHSLHTYRHNANWANLRTLHIKMPVLSHAAHALMHHSTIIVTEILRASRMNLTSLTLEHVPFHEHSFTVPMEFPQLTEMTLYSVKQWPQLHARNATKYSLGFTKGDDERTAQLEFNSPVALEFNSILGTKTQYVLADPQEEEVTVLGTRGWSVSRREVGTTEEPQPCIVHLHDIQVGADELLRELRPQTSIEELHIHNSFVAPIFFKAFCVDPLSRRVGKPPLLPGLQVLEVELSWNHRGHGGKTREAYEPTFQKISEVRKKKSGVLKRLTVRYPMELVGCNNPVEVY